MNTPPQPETTRALLTVEGTRPARWTWHKHVGTSAVDKLPGNGGPGWVHLFECEETGQRRVWGAIRRTGQSWSDN